MTKDEAIEYGVQILKIFPDDISVKDIQWALKNLLEATADEITQQAGERRGAAV